MESSTNHWLARIIRLGTSPRLNSGLHSVLLLGEASGKVGFNTDRSLAEDESACISLPLVGMDEFWSIPILYLPLVSSFSSTSSILSNLISIRNVRGPHYTALNLAALMTPLTPGGEFCSILEEVESDT